MAEQASVVLVHGLWMKGITLALQRWRIARCGFDARLFSYASMRDTLQENAAQLAQFVSSLPAPTIHLVGHSMGGLVILDMLNGTTPDPRIGRVVLLGTPCAGCHASRRLDSFRFGKRILGRCMPTEPQIWSAGENEVGVLSGTSSFGLGRIIRDVPQPNDGVVAVAETLLPGMRDQLSLSVAHSQMLISAEVAKQVCAFLQRGRFLH